MIAGTSEPVAPAGRRYTAYWLLLTTLLGVPLISPLLRWSAVPCTHDGHLHYHRIAALRYAWENGVFVTRWLPDLAFGYGYPFFIYREAPPLYLPFIPHLLGIPLPAASNLFYALTILAAGWFMFLWVRDLFGVRPALVSAVAYMAAPYVLLDALVRGNSPESLALPLLPLILWAGRRWVLFGSIWSFLGGVLGLALLSLSHNISTFIFVPTLLVYLAALVIGVGRGAENTFDESKRQWAVFRGPSIRLGLLLILGLGLAFFYTGGALLEMDQVTLEMSTTTRNNDWRFNFAAPGEILAPVRPEDPALVNPPLLFRLGWIPIGLALLGLTGLWWIKGRDRRAREQRLHIWLMTIGALVYLFMALPLSRFLWESLPLIDFVQFPWRFVGRAALPVAFLAGVPFAHPVFTGSGSTGRLSFLARHPALIAGIAIALLLIETLPNLYPRYCPEEPFPSILTVHAYERATGLVGVDPEGSYFPRTVGERPAGSPLEADYQLAGSDIRRFDETTLPPGATINAIDYSPLKVTVNLDTPAPFTARYLSFAFPGWAVHVDGEPVPITPEDPTGLITFAVPAGSHEITVKWGTTPLRLALSVLSALAAIGVIGVVWWSRRQGSKPVELRSGNGFNRPEYIALALIGLALIGLKLANDRMETPLRQSGMPAVTNAQSLQGGELRLDGFNLSRERVPAGDTVDIDLAWTAIAPPLVDYQSEVWLVGPDGLMWSEKGTERPRLYEDAAPTRLWSPGEWGWDSREIRALSGAPPGTYDIVLTLFDKATLVPVTLTDPVTGEVIGPTASIGQVEITNPASAPAFMPQYTTQVDVVPGLRLLGYNQDREGAIPGESVLLTFFWECLEPDACDQVQLSLLDEAGAAVRQWSVPVIGDGFPAESWPEHGRLRGQHLAHLPADLAGGAYRFAVAGYPLVPFSVRAPDRVFIPPPLTMEIDAAFAAPDGQAAATLVGLAAGTAMPACADEPVPGEACAMPLVWRAESELSTGYHVFVHLVDEQGTILAQSDAVPAHWTRPTTGWLPGEYIVDTHTLSWPATLPEGSLEWRVGLYDPDTGTRLPAGDLDYASIDRPASD